MIAIVKYFGELYLYRVINWREVFDALWAMLAAYQSQLTLDLKLIADSSEQTINQTVFLNIALGFVSHAPC